MTPGGIVTRPLPLWPLCTIIIPCYNEQEFILHAVHAAMGQDYPPDRVEILVVDGRSTDRTRVIVGALARKDPRVRLIDNPARIQSAGMNAAIRRARGDVICRMDAHAEYPATYLARSVEVLRQTGALNVGGAARPKHKTEFQRAMCAALSSPLGVGGSAYRSPDREGYVESVFNGTFRREAFETAGLYDPEAVTNEDAELNQRIIALGGSIYLSRTIVAHYYPRSDLLGLARQYFKYGEGRARTLVKHRHLMSLRPVIPCLMVCTFITLIVASALTRLALPALALAIICYGCLIIAGSAIAARREGAAVAAKLLLIFPTMHLSHGLGMLRGLARYLPRRTATPTLTERLEGR